MSDEIFQLVVQMFAQGTGSGVGPIGTEHDSAKVLRRGPY
jgi:hypothetical protein